MYRVVDLLEEHKDRRGMNLTYEVRDGIVNHTGPVVPDTAEGQVVRISDRIAYINHDIDDAVRSKVIKAEDIPESSLELFGYMHGDRIRNMIENVVGNSDGKEKVSMDNEHTQELNKLRNFMFSNVYKSSKVKKEEDLAKIETVITSLYDYFLKHTRKLPAVILRFSPISGTDKVSVFSGLSTSLTCHFTK